MSDLLHTFRNLLRTPAFTAVVVIILALGIGANTAIFSVVDAAMLKPMPIPDADRVVRLSHGSPQSFVWFNRYGFQVTRGFNDLASFDAVGAYFTGELSLFGTGAGRVRSTAVTPEFFDVLRVYPAIGRPFRVVDLDRSRRLVIISHEMWQTRLDAARDILDRQIVLNGESFDVIGVMPRGFAIPESSEVWVPAAWGGPVAGGRLVAPIVIARMSPGITASQAYDEVARTPHHGHTHVDGHNHAESGMEVAPLRNTLVGDVRMLILLLAAGAFVVLLVACTNIASLLLTRVSSRQREFAVRRALGASDRDIARQVAAESFIVSLMACVVTIPIAIWTLDAIRAWVPIRMYGAADIALDARAAVALAIFALSTALLFSAAPLWASRGRSALDTLRSAAVTTVEPRWRRFRSGLAIAEIALALVLLAGAVTLIRTVATLMTVDLGVRGDRVLVVGLDWPNSSMAPERRDQLSEQFLTAFSSLPGVESVAITTGVPGAFRHQSAELLVDGEDVPPGGGYVGTRIMASRDFFSVFGIDVLAGRVFTQSDHFFAPKVAIVSEGFARRFRLQPHEIVGRRAVLDHRWVQIIGVVRDLRLDGPNASPHATAYIPFAQRFGAGPLNVVIKTHADPAQVIATVRAAGARVNPNVPLYDIRTFHEIRESHVRDRRFVMTLLSSFGTLTFALAVLGLYAVVSYLVHLRTRDIGIRMALGATTAAVRLSVLANGMAHCLAGVLVGCALALGVSRAMSGQLRNLGELDLMTLTIVSGVFLATATLASWLPARRATLIDPVKALRFE